jgi:protein-arginine kinase
MFEAIKNIPGWFLGDDNRVSLYSSVRISRNYGNINFPSSPGYNSHGTVDKKTDGILADHINSGRIIKKAMSSASQEELIKLKKLRLLPEKRNEAILKFTLYYDTVSGTFLLSNYNDHLTFYSNAPGTKISKAYKNCISFLNLFGEGQFAKDSDGNYKTSGLDYFGSGLKCFSVLSLPVLRLAGKMDEITSSLGYNSCSVRDYFGSGNGSFLIISNKDSYSKTPEKTVSDFKKILTELQKTSDIESGNLTESAAELKQKCIEIINSETLTFDDFMKIYNILSFLRQTGRVSTKISVIGEKLGSIIIDSPGSVPGGVLKRSLIGDFTGKIKIELTKKDKK